MHADESTGVLDRYVPRVLLRRLLSDSGDAVVTHDGTLVFVDVSGFTKLSERLARSGKEGAERGSKWSSDPTQRLGGAAR